MTSRLECPDLTTWRRFTLGDLTELVAADLEAHLSICEECLSAITGLAVEDEFVSVLRGRSPVLANVDAEAIDRFLRGLAPLQDDTDPKMVDEDTLSGRLASTLDFLDPPQLPDELGRLGGYRILEQLGAGGMGVVLLASDPQLRRRVAIKILLEHRFSQPHYRARFLREAQTLARLQHPQIVQILGAGQHRGRPYLVLEYVNGGTLASRIAGVPQAIVPAATLSATLARVLHYAHEQGVAHRDIKPSNILLSVPDGADDGRDGIDQAVPKVGDFGLAAEAGSDSLTQSGDLLGTPGYMAPEMTCSARLATPALADVYSLGAVLYELLTGVAPFRGESPLDIVSQVRELEPLSPRRLRPNIPRDLETICLKCLEKSPARRYGSARLLAEELERFLSGSPIKARPLGGTARIWKWSRRRPALAAMSATVIVLSLAMIVGTASYQLRLRGALARATTGEATAIRQTEIATSQYQAAREALHKLLDRAKSKDAAAVPALLELQRDQFQAALAYFESVLRGQVAPDAGTRFDAAEAGLELAVLQSLLGQAAAADESMKHAVDRLSDLVHEFPNTPLYRDRLATGLNNLGMIQTDAAESEQLRQQSLELRKALALQWPDNVEYQNAFAQSLHNLGSHCQQATRPLEATEYYKASLEIRRRIIEERPGEPAYAAQAAETLTNLGLYQPLSEATASYEEAARLLTEAAQIAPQEKKHRDSLAAVYVNWAFKLQASDGRGAAEKATLAIAELDAILQVEPNYAPSRWRLTRAHGNRAQALGALGDLTGALADWDRVVELSDPKEQFQYRAIRAEVLVRSGQYRRAVAEAEALLPQSQGRIDYLTHWALVLSIAAASAGNDTELSAEDRVELADEYAELAMTTLNELERLGGLRDATRRRELREEREYDSLRNHKSFQELLQRIDLDP